MTTKTLAVQDGIKINQEKIPMIIQTSTQFESKLRLVSGCTHVSAKSLLGVMSFFTTISDSLTIEADGPDEQEAAEALVKLICE